MMANLVPVDGDPFSVSGTVTADQGPSTDKKPSQTELKKYLMKEHGLSSAGADGMLRNAYQDESGGDSDAVGDGGTSFGLFQEHNSRGKELFDYADKHKKDADDPYVQVDFAVDELKNKFPDLYKTLQTTKDESQAHDDFRRIFERPASTSGLGKGSVSFSDYAMNEDRGTNTDVHMMSPQDYLDMSPDMDDPWGDKSGKSLLKSLQAGDQIEQLPSLKVDGEGKVTDQDGRHRALAAQDAGLDEIPVAIERPSAKPIASQMTGMTGKTMATPEARPAQTPNRGIMDWIIPGAAASEASPSAGGQPQAGPGTFKSAPGPALPATPETATTQAQQTHIAGQQASEPRLVPVEGNPFANEKETPVNFDPTQKMSFLDKVGTGLLGDPIGRGAELITDALPQGVVNAGNAANNWIADKTGLVAPVPAGGVQQMEQQRQQEVKARGGDRGIGRTLGNVAAGIPAGIAMGPMAAGAVMGALQPTATDDLSNFAWNTVLGAVGGKAASALGNAASRVVAPAFNAAKNLLLREGINLTPGQLAGGVFQRAENALARMPIVGSMVRAVEGRGIEDFNNASLNLALKPIGARLPPGIAPGRPAIAVAQAMASDAYDRALVGTHFMADQQLADDFHSLGGLVREMPPPQAQQFRAIFQNRVMQRLQPTGTMDGQTFKQVDSELGTLAGPYKASQDQGFKQLGSALQELRDTLRDGMERSNPGQRAQLSAANATYAMLSRVEDASARRATPDGVFMPADLIRSIRANARRTGRSKSFAAGNAMMQDFAEAGQEVLPDKLAGSPTEEIRAWHSFMSGGAGVGAYMHPMAAASIGLGALPYTRPGMAAINALAQPAGPVRNALAQVPATLGKYGAAPAGIAATQLSPQQGQ